jgi:hypothetical protein
MKFEVGPCDGLVLVVIAVDTKIMNALSSNAIDFRAESIESMLVPWYAVFVLRRCRQNNTSKSKEFITLESSQFQYRCDCKKESAKNRCLFALPLYCLVVIPSFISQFCKRDHIIMMFFHRFCTCMVSFLLVTKAKASEKTCTGFKNRTLTNETILAVYASRLEWDWHKDPAFAPYVTSNTTFDMHACTYSGSTDAKVKAVQLCDTAGLGNCTSLAVYNDKKCLEPTWCEGGENELPEGASGGFEISCPGLSDEFPDCKIECTLTYDLDNSCGFETTTPDTAPAPAPAPTPASSASSYFAYTNTLLTVVFGMSTMVYNIH